MSVTELRPTGRTRPATKSGSKKAEEIRQQAAPKAGAPAVETAAERRGGIPVQRARKGGERR